MSLPAVPDRLTSFGRSLLHAVRGEDDPPLRFLSQCFTDELRVLSIEIGLEVDFEEADAYDPAHAMVARDLRRLGTPRFLRPVRKTGWASIVEEIGRNMTPPILPLDGARAGEDWHGVEERIAGRYREAGWTPESDPDRVLTAISRVNELRSNVNSRAVIGLVGNPSSGKDSALRAVFGLDTGNINPTAGSTTEVEFYELPGTHKKVLALNTPGLGDVREDISAHARQVLSLIDIYLYVLNAEGGLRSNELDDLNACRSAGRPVVVLLNKIDCLRPADLDAYYSDLLSRVGDQTLVVKCALDPLPAISESPIGVQDVRDAVANELEKEDERRGWRSDWASAVESLRGAAPVPTQAHALAVFELLADQARTAPSKTQALSPYGDPKDVMRRRDPYKIRKIVRIWAVLVLVSFMAFFTSMIVLAVLLFKLFGYIGDRVHDAWLQVEHYSEETSVRMDEQQRVEKPAQENYPGQLAEPHPTVDSIEISQLDTPAGVSLDCAARTSHPENGVVELAFRWQVKTIDGTQWVETGGSRLMPGDYERQALTQVRCLVTPTDSGGRKGEPNKSRWISLNDLPPAPDAAPLEDEPAEPPKETCNGRDDDGDGRIDNGAECKGCSVHHQGSHAYLFCYQEPLAWSAAQTHCQDHGYQLVSIDTAQEASFLLEYEGLHPMPGKLDWHAVWTGLNDLDAEGQWVWALGEPLSHDAYQAWANKEPNNHGGNENCGVLQINPRKDHVGKWQDQSCERALEFICESKDP